MKPRIVEIWAPHYGVVQDVNVYEAPPLVVAAMRKDMRKFGALAHESKAEIDDLFVVKGATGATLVVDVGGRSLSYSLGPSKVETTWGGIAYNAYVDLLALDCGEEPRLSVRPVLGLPPTLISSFARAGRATDSCEPCRPRFAAMIVARNLQLNLVAKRVELDAAAYARMLDSSGPPPDAAVFSTYPAREASRALQRIDRQRRKNPALETYFCPGGTQIRGGVEPLSRLLGRVRAASMQLNEARRLLRVEPSADRRRLALDCARRLAAYGVRTIMLTDAHRGAYLWEDGVLYGTRVYPNAPVDRALGRPRRAHSDNYSGCGDSAFAYLLYCIETTPDMAPEERLTGAMAIARLTSRLPESNLETATAPLIRSVLQSVRSRVSATRLAAAD